MCPTLHPLAGSGRSICPAKRWMCPLCHTSSSRAAPNSPVRHTIIVMSWGISAGLAIEVRPADVKHNRLERFALGVRLLGLHVANQLLDGLDEGHRRKDRGRVQLVGTSYRRHAPAPSCAVSKVTFVHAFRIFCAPSPDELRNRTCDSKSNSLNNMMQRSGSGLFPFSPMPCKRLFLSHGPSPRCLASLCFALHPSRSSRGQALALRPSCPRCSCAARPSVA